MDSEDNRAGMKICLVTDQHISTNPRVWKEADALARNSYDVTIITVDKSAVSKKNDQAILASIHKDIRYSVVANTIPEETSQAIKVLYKAKMAYAVLLKKAGIDTITLLCKSACRIYSQALNVDAALYICHVDCSLYVGRKLIQAGKKVAFDFEDWYSQDYINGRRPVKLLKELEHFALRNAVYTTCPSQAMAHALQNTYDGAQLPHVVYNSFPDEHKNNKRAKGERVTLVWFSQTIGGGRGLENIITCLSKVSEPVTLLLIGDCKTHYRDTLKNLFSSGSIHTMEIKPPVPHAELNSLLARCDIGLALEHKTPQSRNKTVTNKILQYLQAGIKVLATDTDGQKEIAQQLPGIVQLVNAEDNSEWGVNLTTLINKDIEQPKIVAEYNRCFPWIKQEEKILDLVANALEQ